MTFEIKDYDSISSELVTQQFQEQPIFNKYRQLMEAEAITLQNVLSDVMEKRWIETAEGEQLNVIGRIVGQSRDLFDTAIIYYFGFVGATGALSLGTRSDSTIGGLFRGRDDPLLGTRYLNDNEYRALIKIKILKNTTYGVINDFIEMVKLLYNVSTVVITETPGVVTINIGRAYSDPTLPYFKGLDEIVLGRTYLPLPLGIRIEFGP